MLALARDRAKNNTDGMYKEHERAEDEDEKEVEDTPAGT